MSNIRSAYRFVPLSSQPLTKPIPATSALYRPAHARCNKHFANAPDCMPMGLLLIYEHRKANSGATATPTTTTTSVAPYTRVCIRQMPLFKQRDGSLGIYVPFTQDIADYCGIHLYSAQNIPNAVQVVNTIRAITKDTSKDFLPTVVEFASFDPKYVHAGHLDQVRNMVQPKQDGTGTGATPTATAKKPPNVLFYLSNYWFSDLEALHDQFVGYIELGSLPGPTTATGGTAPLDRTTSTDTAPLVSRKKWPVFLDSGFLGLKLNSFKSLLTKLPFWIDGQYRIRLGEWSEEPDKRPCVVFTTMRIVVPPTCFEYGTKYAESLKAEPKYKMCPKCAYKTETSGGGEEGAAAPTATEPQEASSPTPTVPPPLARPIERDSISATSIFGSQSFWQDAAGISFVPRASNSLNYRDGQIPHNFPIQETKPRIAIAPWLPRRILDIVEDGQKSHRALIQNLRAKSAALEPQKKKQQNGSSGSGATSRSKN